MSPALHDRAFHPHHHHERTMRGPSYITSSDDSPSYSTGLGLSYDADLPASTDVDDSDLAGSTLADLLDDDLFSEAYAEIFPRLFEGSLRPEDLIRCVVCPENQSAPHLEHFTQLRS